MLEIKNLSVTYQTGSHPVHAVDNVSFTVKKGESLGIMGESGCGKSTLASAVMGIVPNATVTGEILFHNANLLAMDKKELKSIQWKRIAMVFQNALEVFNPVLTIGEQIAEPLRSHYRLPPKEIAGRVRHCLEQTGLDPEWETAYPHQLSGGMRQRALIAMAISCEPEFLIVDEPTTSLDPESQNTMLALIEDLQRKMGFSMMMISHHLGALARMTSKVISMYQGQVLEHGVTAEIMKDPMHCYTRGLLNASPELFTFKDLWGINDRDNRTTPNDGCAFSGRCCQRDEGCGTLRPVLRAVSPRRKVACHKNGIQTLLSASGLKKAYRLNGRRIPAVKGVDLEIKTGEIVALMGKSGSGKSTLAHMLVNLFEPDKGEIVFAGQRVSGCEATRKPGGMQIVFQDPFSAVSHRMTVLEVVREPLDIIKWNGPKQRNPKAVSALTMAGLPDSDAFLDRHACTLSGGQRQRLAIARALVTDPKLLVADEITAMLDPSTKATLLRTLKGLQNRHGFSMLFITHDFYLARKVADKACVMSDGLIVEAGPSFEIFERPVHPATISLMHSSLNTYIN